MGLNCLKARATLRRQVIFIPTFREFLVLTFSTSEIFTKFTGKHLCQSLFCYKVDFVKRRLWHRCFPVNFAKFLRTLVFIEHLWSLLLPLVTIVTIITFVYREVADQFYVIDKNFFAEQKKYINRSDIPLDDSLF